jgi:serine O-acetyltransferase
MSATLLSQELLATGPLLHSDIEMALLNDPATADPLEVLLCYPGFKATAAHRIAHVFYRHNIPLLPRMIAEVSHEQTGIDIHPGAQIGSHFFIDHGTGVVIGETAIIGNRVTIFQGVTLGAKRFERTADGSVVKGKPRHPIIGDNVTIYSGATVLGRITVGKGSVIGGNVWLTESVGEQSRVTQQQFVSTYFTAGDGI